MKPFAIAACCALTAVGVWLWVPEELIEDLTGDDTGYAVQDEPSWDEKNRRPTKEIFFCEVPDWIRGSGGKNSPRSQSVNHAAPVSSGVQGNPFAD